MANSKTFVAKKDFMLDCGHAVKQGDEFVITSIFTCKADTPKREKPESDKPASWGQILKRQL